MKSIKQAEEIYSVCVQAAKKGRTITYREVLDKLGYGPGVSGQAIRYGLELAWVACGHKGLPSLMAIVVSQSTGVPSEGYSSQNWKRDAQEVFKAREWPNADSINWDYVWKNRVELSEKFGTRGYWNVYRKSYPMDANNPRDVVIDLDQVFVDEIYGNDHIYHPRRYRRQVGEYKTFFQVDFTPDSFIPYKVLPTVGDDQWSLLKVISEALGVISIDDLMNTISFCDNTTGDLCYFTWKPQYFCQDILSKNGDRWLTLCFKVLITDEIEELEIGVEYSHELSLLQHALDQKGSHICLIPSIKCISLWESEIHDKFDAMVEKSDRMKIEFLNLLEEKGTLNLFESYRILPKLQMGDGLIKVVKIWLAGKEYRNDLDLALWVIKSRSKQIYEKISKEVNSIRKKLNEAFAELLSEANNPVHTPRLNHPSAIKIKEQKIAKKRTILNELGWFYEK